VAKVKIEFINTCARCAAYEQAIKKAAAKFGDDVEVKFYQAGRDFDYLKKYGMISKGTMIIDGKKKFDTLSGEIIEKAIKDAIETNGV
jgi:Thioredoxin domain